MADKPTDQLMAIMMQDKASELLASLAGRADAGEAISVSSLQSLSNLRALAGQQYLPAMNAASFEKRIRAAPITGTLDPKLKNMDPDYLTTLLPPDFQMPSAKSGCLGQAVISAVCVCATIMITATL